jgi:hypothetical protein
LLNSSFESENRTNKRDEMPKIDDEYLKYYARLISNLKKLIDSIKNKDSVNHNADQPLYCVKIVVLYGQLSRFRPEYWSMVNSEDLPGMKNICCKIKKLLRTSKDTINSLVQVNIFF